MVCLLLACACVGARAHAADVAGVENVRFRNYSTSEGLSQATARALVQDQTGFIWIGTQDGLDRFDGYSFKVYRHDRNDPWSLGDNHIFALATDGATGLWVGTQSGGLHHYDSMLDRFTRYRADSTRADALASDSISALLRDHAGRLWIASGAARLQWFDPATQGFRDIPLGTSKPLNNVRQLLQLGDGSVLIGAHEGLWHCSADGRDAHEWHAADEPSLQVEGLALAPDGHVWISTADRGLFEFSADGNALAHFHRGADSAHDLPDDELRALTFDREGRLWLSTANSGLVRFSADRSRYRVYRHDPARPNSLAAQRQQALLIDRDGLLWAGSWVNGVSMHDPRTEVFTDIRRVPGDARSLPGESVNSVLANADGTLWMGSSENGGLVHFDPVLGVLAHYTNDPKLPGSVPPGLIHHLIRAHDGSIWLATTGSGIAHMPLGASTFIRYRHVADDPGSLGGDDVRFLMEDRSGTLWIATQEAGLDELCAGCSAFKHHRHDPVRANSIGSDSISSLLETRNGDLWIGTRFDGIDAYDRASDRFTHFRARPDDATSLSHNSITTLTETQAGELWIGTQGGGLNHLLPATAAAPRFEAITTAEGLGADAIGGVVEDDANVLWVSTTAGISRYDPHTRAIANFGVDDGTLGQGYFIRPYARLPDGRIVFGGLSGATLFDPAAVRPPVPPLPVITELLLSNASVSPRWRDPDSPLAAMPWSEHGSAVLNHHQHNVGFAFSAFSFSHPEAVSYSYRLEGHDENWINTDASRRFATYTDLAPGSYRLRVRARNNGAEWSEREAALDLRVLPAPWASPLAYLGYALTALLIALLIGWRIRANWRDKAHVQETIRASEERLKYALWGSGSELWDVDLQTGAMLRENRLDELLANDAASHQTVQDFRPFVHPDDLPQFEQELASHLKGGKDFLEISYRSQDRLGEWRWLLTRGRIAERDASGRATRLVGTTHDITTLKRAEESLRKLNEELESRVEMRTLDLRRTNAELRRALEQLTHAQRQLLESEKMAALGGLVAGVAHEINTPLGVTVTAASHLQEEAARIVSRIAANELTRDELESFEATARESSQMILRNLQRADRLIKSFKLVAVDQSSEERRTIELGAYLNEILTSLGPTLRKNPHRVHVDCPEPVTVNTYPGALYQIISNLVMNSLIHAFDPGQAGEIVIEARRAGTLILLQYRDNGKGMNEAVRAQVFEPFFTTRRGQGGSGLGMHVVYNLVTQLLKGSIRIETAPGAGARFEIFLPLDLGVPAEVASLV